MSPDPRQEATSQPLPLGTTADAEPTLSAHEVSILESSDRDVLEPSQLSLTEGREIQLGQDFHLYGVDKPRRRFIRAQIMQ